MARIRSVHPSLLVSEDIADLTIGCQMHFVRLWVVADDSGRGKDRARWLKGVAWPIQDDVSVDQIEEWQAELAANGRIVRYEAKGETWWQIVNFGEYQKPSKPSASKIDPPPDSVTSALKASVPESPTPSDEPTVTASNGDETDTDSGSPTRPSANTHGPSPSSPGTPVGDREWSGVGVEGEGSGEGGHDPPVIPSPVDKPPDPAKPPQAAAPKPPTRKRRRAQPRQRGSPGRTERDRAHTCWHQEVAPAITRHGRQARWRQLAWAEPRIPDVITAAGGWTTLCNMPASDAEKAFTTAWTTSSELTRSTA